MDHGQLNQHLIPLQSKQTSVGYTYINKGDSLDNLLRQWMRANLQEADNVANTGHMSINQIMLADFKDGKRDEYLGAPYWVYENNNMAYREALPDEPVEDESSDESIQTVILDDHFFEEEHHNCNQQSQLRFRSVAPPPPRPMTPPLIPFGHVVTCAGRIVNPPECYGFGNPGPKVPTRNAPPWPPTSDNQPLEGLEGCQWANLSVLLIDEPMYYRQAKVSPQWWDGKKPMDDELKSLKEKDVSDEIPEPVGRKIVANRRVFKAKGNAQGEVEHYQAQIVATGFAQTLGQD